MVSVSDQKTSQGVTCEPLLTLERSSTGRYSDGYVRWRRPCSCTFFLRVISARILQGPVRDECPAPAPLHTLNRHGTDCPQGQAPWPDEQSWLKRKTFSALPRKSCRLNRVVTLLKWQADECSKAAVRVFFFTVRATLRVARTVGSGCAAGESTGAHGGRNLGLMALQGCGGLST